MKKLILLLLLIPIIVNAQNATSSNSFVFDQGAPDLSAANSYTYKYYIDSSLVGVNFISVACTGAVSPFVCTVLIPTFSPGNHNIQLTASNIAGESIKSSPFAFVFVVTPVVPVNIRIK